MQRSVPCCLLWNYAKVHTCNKKHTDLARKTGISLCENKRKDTNSEGKKEKWHQRETPNSEKNRYLSKSEDLVDRIWYQESDGQILDTKSGHHILAIRSWLPDPGFQI